MQINFTVLLNSVIEVSDKQIFFNYIVRTNFDYVVWT